MDSVYVLWTGRALSGLFAAFILVASVGPKLAGARVALDSFANLGWSADQVLLIGIIELSCLVLYLVPNTSVAGAILMTALLGGATAAHLRVGSPMLSHVLFGVYLGLFMWGGLWLRDPSLRALFPLRFA